MRKLLSIGIILALLVTFIVPVVVAAQEEDCCGYTPPTCDTKLPDRVTKTLAGAAMWTLLGTADIMGKAVCSTTGQLVCNLGGWSDELGVIGVELTAATLEGVSGLVEFVFAEFLQMADLGKAVSDLLKNIAEVLAGAAE